MDKVISYLRVSTKRQGASGLGLEAQRDAVARYLKDGALLAEFVEVESGGKNDRPKLIQALELCRMTGATLLIAKLDRLSRNAHFLIGLQRAGVPFKAVDAPGCDAFTVGILALVAERERLMTSERTKAALGAAKRRGVKLGGFKGTLPPPGEGAKANREAADVFSRLVGPMIQTARGEGKSLRQIAAAMEGRGVRTPRGGRWSSELVRNVLGRMDQAAA